MKKKPIKEVFMSFPAEESQLEEIRKSIRNVLADTQLTNKDINGVLLAVEEVCTNVIRHAYLYSPGTIRIKIQLRNDEVIFSVFDKGNPFKFDETETPDLGRYVETGRKGGLGLYLIRKMMDSVEYFSRDDENEFRMHKSIARVPTIKIKPHGISIRVKFSIWASLVVFAIVSSVFLYIDQKSSHGSSARFFKNADDAMALFIGDIGDKLVLRDLDLVKSASAWIKANSKFDDLIITDTSGIIVADPKNPGNFLSTFSKFPDDYYNNDVSVIDTSNVEGFYYKKSILLNNNLVGYAYFRLLYEPLEQELASARQGLIAIAVIGLIVGFFAVFLLSNYFVKPIQKLTEGVLRIGDGNLDQTLPVEGTDEFSEIARAFNEITAKFKKSQESVVEQERLQKEMQVAQEIQHTLLPKMFPDIEGYDIATIYRAAKDVGGDYFDFVQIDKETLGIIVADVSGKGVPGSLVMTMIRTALRLESRENYSPTDILSRVNKFVADDVKKGMFITIFFITLNSKKRTISYASAGHNPMILYRKDVDSCYFLNTRGMPLGISLPDDVNFDDSLEHDTVRLKKDDMLIIYTDGITEAMNKAGVQYGNDRLIEFIKTNSDLHPDEFVAKLDADIHRFTAGAPQNDDITLVAIKEKIMLDEVIFEKRKKLIEMVEVDGIPVEEACEKMEVSVSTYYKYRKRWKEFGDMGLLNKKLRAESDLKQISYEARKEILKIVREMPEYGVKRISAELDRRNVISVDQRGLYEELVRMRLNTKKLRLEYVDRMGGLSPEMRAELDKELLRDKEKVAREKFDRDGYLEKLKNSLNLKRESADAESANMLEQLKDLEEILGDPGLYAEIASELGKLGGGENIAGLFEKMIIKMAETKLKPVDESKPKEKISIEENTLNSQTEKKIDIPPETVKSDPGNLKMFADDLQQDDIPSEPIDISQSAAENDEQAENRDKFNWDEYEKRLSKKFDRK